MKNTLVLLAFILLFSFASCSSTKVSSSEVTVGDHNKSDCTFDCGNDVSSGFTGTAYFRNLVPLDSTYNFPETNVITFAPDSRSSWHTHGGMYVIGVGGVGLYQEEGKDAIIIRKGDVIQIPEGVKHWHGGSLSDDFAHIAANTNPDRPGVEWFDMLSEEDYAKLQDLIQK